MKLLTLLLTLVFLFMLAFATFYLYQNLPGEEINMKIKNLNTLNPNNNIKNLPVNASGEVTQFFPNMRFNHNNLTFFINPECSAEKVARMNRAFSIITQEIGIITFHEDSEENSDILVGCSLDSYETEKNVFIAGEGGPTKIINLTNYALILRGKVILYNETSCDYPITELHELFHVLGFAHINNSKLIMYPYVDCDQKINFKMISMIKELYSIEPKAELYFENITATKKGIYLDFRVIVRNDGLIAAKNVTLNVYSENKKINSFSLGNLESGVETNFEVQNLKLSSRNAVNVKMEIVSETPEDDITNNVAELEVKA